MSASMPPAPTAGVARSTGPRRSDTSATSSTPTSGSPSGSPSCVGPCPTTRRAPGSSSRPRCRSSSSRSRSPASARSRSIGPLGIPWWLPLILLVLGVGVVAALSNLAGRKTHGLWQGLAVLRGLRHRNTIIALTIFAVSAQVFRNWLVLRGIGVDISVFDSMALLIATAALGLLPIGPSLGVATTVLILGSRGVAQTAAAGALLTATGAVGAMLFASWALADRWRTRGPRRTLE